VQHGIRQNVDRDRRMLGRQIHVVDRAIEGRVGVDVAAVRLYRPRDLRARAARSALKQHVF